MATERANVITIDEQELLADINSPQDSVRRDGGSKVSSHPPLRPVLSSLPPHQTAPSMIAEEPPLHDAETGLRAVRVALKILDKSRQTLTDAEASLIDTHNAVDRAKAEVDANTRRLADGLIEHRSASWSHDLKDLFASSAEAIQGLDAALIELKFAHSWCQSAYQMHLAHLAAEEKARSELARPGQSD